MRRLFAVVSAVFVAIFDEPGIYVLRARADDGALAEDRELTVTVTR